MDKFALPKPEELNITLSRAFKRRRSRRHFAAEPLRPSTLSTLAWAAYGINAARGGLNLRTAPSAGATYPIELYVIINKCRELNSGLYRYKADSQSLSVLNLKELAVVAGVACLNQDFVARAAAVFIWTAVIERCRRRYQQRAYRYAYLEAGHQAQNLLLAASALDLAACPVGAFHDDEIAELLGVNAGEEPPLYAVALGLPAQT